MKIVIGRNGRAVSMELPDGLILDDAFIAEATVDLVTHAAAGAWDATVPEQFERIVAKGTEEGWRDRWLIVFAVGAHAYASYSPEAPDGGGEDVAEMVLQQALVARKMLWRERYGERNIAALKALADAMEAGADEATVRDLMAAHLVIEHAPIFDLPPA